MNIDTVTLAAAFFILIIAVLVLSSCATTTFEHSIHDTQSHDPWQGLRVVTTVPVE
jgi:hypothetical protein